MSKYNGWTNWETWNVMLWVTNEEPLYRRVRSFVRCHILTESRVQDFMLEIFPEGTPDMDGVHEMDRVNWFELSESLQSEAENF